MQNLSDQLRYHGTFVRALEDGDYNVLRGIWHRIFPQAPAPADNEQAEAAMHMARTGTASLRLEKRLYSHAWLFERGLPSQLPHELRPKYEGRPIIFDAVGISVKSKSDRLDRIEEAKVIEKLMSDAVAELYALGIKDPVVVSKRMWQARDDYINGRIRKVI